MIARRGFIAGMVGLVAAPAIVRAASLMPVSSIDPVYYGNNSLLTMQMITREAVKLFSQSNQFLQNIDRPYDDEFSKESAIIGSTLRIRLTNDYSVLAAKTPWIDAPPIDDKLALAAAAPFVVAKVLEVPVTRRFWAA